MNFRSLEVIYKKWLILDEDPDLVRVVFACVLVNQNKGGKPSWLTLIGKPSTGKSEILKSLSSCRQVHIADQLTAKSLMSGFKQGDQEFALLPRIVGKVLVIADATTVLSMYPDDRKAFFSTLRAAYDGDMRTETGIGSVEMRGKIGLILAGTPSLEREPMMGSQLGERFLYIRSRLGTMPEGSPERDVFLMRAKQNGRRADELQYELRDAALKFLDKFKIPQEIKLRTSTLRRIDKIALAIVKARTTVSRDRYSKEIDFPAEISEMEGRASQQIANLCGMFKVIEPTRSENVDTDALRLANRLLLDNIPYVKMRVIKAVHEGNVTLKEIAKAISMSDPPTHRHLRDLELVKILGQDTWSRWSIVDDSIAEAFATQIPAVIA